MAYLALYRKFRPRKFADVLGQNLITTALRNQVRYGRVAHAYLFSGTRGTGKTSTAKVFAQAVNCAAPQNGEPCGVCGNCADGDAAVDIIEIDAASNTGVDQIRDLLEKVKFAPVKAQHKIYIIDEVHMLSTSSFNALLKTLEEPPPHVIFILATTEPQKVPPTILSRCQRYEFRRLPTALIAESLDKIAGAIGLHYDAGAITAIARAAEGGMRDALSLMDQCLAYCGETAAVSEVLSVLGNMDQGFMFVAVDALLTEDCAAALSCVSGVLQSGNELGVFCRDLIAHLRNVLLIAACKDARALLDRSDDYNRYAAQAKSGPSRILRAIGLLVKAEQDMKQLMPRTILETALIRICTPEDVLLVNAAPRRTDPPKGRADESAPSPIPSQTETAPIAPGQLESASPAHAPPQPEKPFTPETQPPPSSQGDAAALFARFTALLKPNLTPLVSDATPSVDGAVLRVALPEKFWSLQDMLNAETAKLADELGRALPGMEVRFVKANGPSDIKQKIRAFFGEDVRIVEE